MSIFINIYSEIDVIEHYEGYGLEIVKGSNNAILNRIEDSYYLELNSFALLVGISIDQLLESISFITVTGEYLAYYRNEQHKLIRVLEITGLNELIRGLRSLGYNLELLKTIHDQCYKIHEQIRERSN